MAYFLAPNPCPATTSLEVFVAHCEASVALSPASTVLVLTSTASALALFPKSGSAPRKTSASSEKVDGRWRLGGVGSCVICVTILFLKLD